MSDSDEMIDENFADSVWVLYRDREDWKDVVPVLQDDGPDPVVAIDYSVKCKVYFNLFILFIIFLICCYLREFLFKQIRYLINIIVKINLLILFISNLFLNYNKLHKITNNLFLQFAMSMITFVEF